MKRILFLLVMCFTVGCEMLFSQNSVYKHFSPENLPFNKTYSSLIDHDGFMLIATFEGVYKFDGASYELLAQESNQLIILLKKTEHNRIFAVGINNTVFEIKNDSLHLLHQQGATPSQFIDFVDLGNSLLLTGNGNHILQISETENRIDTLSIDFGEAFKNDLIAQVDPIFHENAIVYLQVKSNKRQIIGSYNLKTQESQILKEIPVETGFLKVKLFQGEKYLLVTSPHVNSDSIFKVNGDEITSINFNFDDIEKVNRLRVLSTEKNIAFATYSGLEIFNSDFQKTHHLLKGKIITGASFIQNALWITTNNHGIYFFPNYKVRVIHASSNDQIGSHFSQMHVFKGHPLVSSANGKIFEITENGLEKLNNNTLKNVIDAPFKYKNGNMDTLFLPFQAKDYLLYEENGALEVKEAKGWGNKDRTYFEGMTLSSSHSGTYLLFDSSNWKTNDLIIPRSIRQTNIRGRKDKGYFYKLSKQRTARNFYNPKDTSLWFGPGGRLCRIDANSIDTMKLNGKIINTVELKLEADSQIWFSDWNHIYTYQNGVKPVVNLEKKFEVSNFTVEPDYIYIATNLGVVQFNRKTGERKQLNFIDGLPSDDIYAAVSHDGILYTATTNSVGLIPIDAKPTPREKCVARFKSIKFNSINYDSQEEVSLPHDQNDLEIELASLDLINIGQLSCFYKLKGIDNEWILTNSSEPIRYPNLASGSYEFVAYFQTIKGEKSEPISFDFEVNAPFWQRWWFIATSAILLILITAVIVSARNKAKQEKLATAQKLIQSEIDGLKSQMNPHFVFNSLNSIQDLILSQDFKSSTIYLGKFSSLLRMTLEFSSKRRITLAEEVESLSIYLELEALRFGKQLQYSIDIENETLEDFEIPPMLIQPFVENAFKHGLFESTKELKKLTVKFYQENKMVYCSIEDNGIGRAAAAEVKRRREVNHKSFATKAIERRLDLINETLERNIEAKTIDLEEGTRVELRFPRNY